MSSTRRFIVGSVIGVALTALASFLSVGDRGTYAPMIANSAFAMFLPGFVYTMMWFPVLLWGLYFAVIPDLPAWLVNCGCAHLAYATGVEANSQSRVVVAYVASAQQIVGRERRERISVMRDEL